MNEYQDKNFTCICGEPFVWTAGEQKFMNDLYEEGKITEVKPPRRCKDCRIKKRREMEARGQQ